MGVTIGAIGFVYSVLFHQDIATYLPFLGIRIVCWGLIAGIVTEGCTAFRQSADFMRQSRLPRSVFVYYVLLRNVIIFAHNLAIVVLILIVFAVPVGWATLLVIPGPPADLPDRRMGRSSARAAVRPLRGLPQVIASVVQIPLFSSPPSSTRRSRPVAGCSVDHHLNPFASYLALLPGPAARPGSEATHYAMAVLVMVGGFAVTLPVFSRFSRPHRLLAVSAGHPMALIDLKGVGLDFPIYDSRARSLVQAGDHRSRRPVEPEEW